MGRHGGKGKRRHPRAAIPIMTFYGVPMGLDTRFKPWRRYPRRRTGLAGDRCAPPPDGRSGRNARYAMRDVGLAAFRCGGTDNGGPGPGARIDLRPDGGGPMPRGRVRRGCPRPIPRRTLPGRDHGPGNAPGKPGRGPVPGRNARPVPVAGLLTYPRFRKARSAEPDIAFGTRRRPARPPRPRRRGTAAGTLPQPEAQSHSRPLRGRGAAGCAPDHRMPAAARYGRLPG